MYSLSSPGAVRRVPTSLLLVVGLHLVALWALINGLHVHAFAPTAVQTEAAVIDAPAPPPEKFIPPDPSLSTITHIEEEQPLISEPLPPDPVSAPIVDSLPPVGPGAGATIVPEPVITRAAVDPRHPLTQPAYPMGSIRGSEEGALEVSVLVGTDGRVRDAKVAQSSGFSRLDQAAVNEAKSRWHLRPAMRDGVPFEQWLTLRVVFRLENR